MFWGTKLIWHKFTMDKEATPQEDGLDIILWNHILKLPRHLSIFCRIKRYILYLISDFITKLEYLIWDWFCTACHIVTAAMNPLNSTSLDLARLRCYLKDGYQKPEKIVHFFHNALKIRSDSRFRTKLKSSINLSETKRLSNKDAFLKSLE